MKTFYGFTIGRALGFFLAAACLVGCSHPAKTSLSLREVEEAIRRNSELVRLDSNNVAAHRALGDAFLEQARIQLRMARSRKQDYPYSMGSRASAPTGFEQAIFHLSAASRLDSLNDAVWTELGRACFLRFTSTLVFARRDVRKAREFLQKALSLNPRSSQANYLLGVIYGSFYYSYKPEQSISLLQRAIETRPNFADALKALGEIYDRQRSYVLAHSFARRALNAGLSDPQAYLDIGNSEPNWHLMSSYRASTRNVPLIARGLFGLGMQVFLMSDLEWQYKMYSRALEIEPTSSEMLSNYGYVCWRRGDTARAIECYMRCDLRHRSYNEQFYERVISEHADFVSAYVDLSHQLSYQSIDKSIALLKRAISIDRTRGDAHILLSNAYSKKGTPDSAISYLEKYLDAPKVDTAYGVYSYLGWLYALGRDFQKLKNLYTKAQGPVKTAVLGLWTDARVEPQAYLRLISDDSRSNSLVYSALAKLADHKGDPAVELLYWEKAFRCDPQNEVAGSSLMQMYMERGKYDQALTMCTALMKSKPEDTEYLYAAAVSLDKLGRRKEAAANYRRISELEPDDAEDSYTYATRIPNTPDQVSSYQRAARLGYKAAQDTLKNRNISW